MQLPDEPGMLTLEEEKEISERLRSLVDNFTEFTFSEMTSYAIARAVAGVARFKPAAEVSAKDVADAYRLLQSEQAWMSGTRADLLNAFDGIDKADEQVAFQATALNREGRAKLVRKIRDREDELRRREQIAIGVIKN
jgi:hypothetical protein